MTDTTGEGSYEAKLDEFHDRIKLVFNGNASEMLVDTIEKLLSV